jgi:hypothetical protein
LRSAIATWNTSAGRQQALPAQCRQGGAGAVALDRVLHHFQGLVDGVQVARHLRFVGFQLLARGIARGVVGGQVFGIDEVDGRDPDRDQRQQREQRQRDVGLERAPEPAAQAPRREIGHHCTTSTWRTLASSALRSM